MRFDADAPLAGRLSFVASHPRLPFVGVLPPHIQAGQSALERVADAYLLHLAGAVRNDQFTRIVTEAHSECEWLPVWPQLGVERRPGTAPAQASWNLRIRANQALPASIAMTKSGNCPKCRGDVSGICVPIVAEETPSGLRITIKGMTAEVSDGPVAFSRDTSPELSRPEHAGVHLRI